MSTARRASSAPKTVSIRDLSRNAGTILRSLHAANRPAVVTERGRPVGILFPTDPDEFEDFVIEHAAEFVEARMAAHREVSEGRARRLSDVAAEIEAGGQTEADASG